MSLINDALRRAKQAQQDTPPADPTPVTHFRPVEPTIQPARHGLGVMLPVLLALVALLALLLLWELSRRGPSAASAQANSSLNVAARALPAEQPTPTGAKPSTSSTETSEVSNSASVKPVAENPAEAIAGAPGHNSSTAPALNSAGSNTNAGTAATDTSDGNHSVAAEPTPTPLKLQGIVYDPRRPSAMINGRVMFVGDRIRDLRITTIHASEVVLTGAGRTNILSLEP